MLQTLVRAGILKGVRGPRGGYELARERRRISAGDIVRAAMTDVGDGSEPVTPDSALVSDVILPMVAEANCAYLAVLDSISVADLCARAEDRRVFGEAAVAEDFAI